MFLYICQDVCFLYDMTLRQPFTLHEVHSPEIRNLLLLSKRNDKYLICQHFRVNPLGYIKWFFFYLITNNAFSTHSYEMYPTRIFFLAKSSTEYITEDCQLKFFGTHNTRYILFEGKNWHPIRALCWAEWRLFKHGRNSVIHLNLIFVMWHFDFFH